MKISEFLKSVRANMSPETWTKKVLCRTQDGTPGNYMSESACTFCLYGYLYRTDFLLSKAGKTSIGVEIGEELTDLIIKANPQIPGTPYCKIADYNDNPATTFEDIVKVIDNTIALAEGRGL